MVDLDMKLTKDTFLYWDVCPYLYVMTLESKEPNQKKKQQLLNTSCEIILYGGGECKREGICVRNEKITK